MNPGPLSDRGVVSTDNALPLLSIIMPTHNRCQQLYRAVMSLHQQQYPVDKVEIIVVLDGCNDGSREMLQGFSSSQGPRLLILEQPSAGPAAARNRGCAAAGGEIIVFLDDDVRASPLLLLEHAKVHCHDDRVVTIGTMMPPPDFQRPIWIHWEEQMLLKQYEAMIRGYYPATYRQFFTGNAGVARRWLEASGGFDITFRRAEDVELAARLAALGLNFVFLPQAEAYHYAYRSYQAWYHAHYAYGQADVIMERERGHGGRIALSIEEMRERSLLIRWCCRFLLDRPRAQLVANQIFLVVALLLAGIRLESIAVKSLSAVANYQYWQGFNDALRFRTNY